MQEKIGRQASKQTLDLFFVCLCGLFLYGVLGGCWMVVSPFCVYVRKMIPDFLSLP